MIATHYIKMDLFMKGVTPRIDAVQDDKYSRQLVISLYEGPRKWNIPGGTTAIICYKKKRTGSTDCYDTLPDGTIAYHIDGNVLTVALAPQVCTAVGMVELAVKLINADAELNTFTVEINVHETPGLQTASASYHHVTGMLPSSGWEPNMYLGTDEKGNVITKPVPSGGNTPDPVPPVVTVHGVVWDLVNVTCSNPIASASDGTSLVAVLTADSGYTLGDVTVTMGGETLTGVWNADTATVTIASVTGDVIISCAGVELGTAEPVNTSPIIAQENMAYQSASSSVLASLQSRKGMCVTKIYEYPSLADAYAEAGAISAEGNTIISVGYIPLIAYYAPNVKYTENAEANGYPTSSIARYSKIVLTTDGVVTWHLSNGSYATNGPAWGVAGSTGGSDGWNCITPNGIVFTLFADDAEDSYAYWTLSDKAGTTKPNGILPPGVRDGDIIFAGKNTPYYGMVNIDGTLSGQTATAELSYDDDLAQDYAVATASILGEETAADTGTAYGISSSLAAVIDEVRTAWMMEYGGDYRKIPLVITTDQHARTNSGIFNMLGKTLSMHDVSKVVNLGDTVSVEWFDEDTAKPLVSCPQLEKWCESIKAIPFSKRLDVYGNHDTWYGNYGDEGNTIGTRYPANQSHLDQYFRNIHARRTNNNGWFVIHDDYFNVKYVVISGFEYRGSVTFRIGTKQMQFIIDEFGKDDGYDIVVFSHVPLRYKSEEMTFPTGHEYTIAEDYRVADIDTDALFAARKNKSSGAVTDSDGVEHSFDFSGCTTDILCGLHGHTHHDAYIHVGDNGLLSHSFDWFDGNTIHFVLVDRINRQLNVWKVEGDALTWQNYQVPFDKINT